MHQIDVLRLSRATDFAHAVSVEIADADPPNRRVCTALSFDARLGNSTMMRRTRIEQRGIGCSQAFVQGRPNSR